MSEPEVRVHLVQCLCPARHCIMAAAFQEPPGTQDEAIALVKKAIENAIAAESIDPWCGLCKAPRDQWSFEIAQLPGRTLEEVLPALRKSEAEQLATAAAMQSAGRHNRN